jgi:hypothetical protein
MAEQVEPTQEQIRQRAYEIFEERGRVHGRDTEDWLGAEQQLRTRAFENLMRAICDHRGVAPPRTSIYFRETAQADVAQSASF